MDFIPQKSARIISSNPTEIRTIWGLKGVACDGVIARAIYADTSGRSPSVPVRNHACGLHQERGGTPRASEGRSEGWDDSFTHPSPFTFKDANNVGFFLCAGNIPSWLQGTLLRNGPGLFSVGETSYEHWFDGMAIMNSFVFKDGASMWRSSFRNKSSEGDFVLKGELIEKYFVLFATGEVSHRSKFLRSDTYKANMAANRIVVSEMGTMAYPDPSKNFIVK